MQEGINNLMNLLLSSEENYLLGRMLMKSQKVTIKSLLKCWGLKSLRRYKRKNKANKYILTFETLKVSIIKRFDTREAIYNKNKSKKSPRFELIFQEKRSRYNILKKKEDFIWVITDSPKNVLFLNIRDVLLAINQKIN